MKSSVKVYSSFTQLDCWRAKIVLKTTKIEWHSQQKIHATGMMEQGHQLIPDELRSFAPIRSVSCHTIASYKIQEPIDKIIWKPATKTGGSLVNVAKNDSVDALAHPTCKKTSGG